MAWKDRTRGRISQEHVEFSSDSQLNHFEFGKPPNMKFLGKLAFQVLKFAKDLWQILRSTRRFLVLYLMFLIFSFCCQALRCLLPKKKANLAQFWQFQITFISLFADPIPGLLNFFIVTLKMPKKEHVFSIATTMWHSTLSLLTLLFSCEQGLPILTGQRSWVKSDFSLLSHFTSSTILTGIEQVCAFGWISWLKVRASINLNLTKLFSPNTPYTL